MEKPERNYSKGDVWEIIKLSYAEFNGVGGRPDLFDYVINKYDQSLISKLESENKLLREEIGEWKSMGLEAANEISRLKKEIERLKLDV